MTDDHKAEALREALARTLAQWRDIVPEDWATEMYLGAADAILARFNVTERDEERWEWGVRFEEMPNDPPAFIGAEEGARYFMGRPNNSVLKYAKEDWVKRLVRRRPASEWEAFDE